MSFEVANYIEYTYVVRVSDINIELVVHKREKHCQGFFGKKTWNLNTGLCNPHEKEINYLIVDN